MKKALVISYIFPPIGGSGVQRTTKFVKYMHEFGWQPLVVCGDDGEVFQDGLDHTLLAEIPSDVPIHRVHFNSPLRFRRWVQKKLKIKPLNEMAAQPGTDASGAGEQNPNHNMSVGRRLARGLSALLSPFEFPPVDAALYWAIGLVPLCLKIIRQEKVDLIYTTSFPYSDHVTGYLLKHLTGKPWVADFRDPWTQHADNRNSGWRRLVDIIVERHVLQYADKIVAVTPSYTKGLHSLAKNRASNHFITIENGFDSFDFAPGRRENQPHSSNHKITLSHVGYIYNGTALTFLQALHSLELDVLDKLHFRFIGRLEAQETDWIHQNKLCNTIEVSNRIPHAQAIQVMRDSDVVLLFIGAGSAWQGHYPGKLFEYMASGAPILMIGPDGDTKHLIEASGAGLCISYEDIEGIKRILRLLAADKNPADVLNFHPNSSLIARFERISLTQCLTKVFDEITSPVNIGK